MTNYQQQIRTTLNKMPAAKVREVLLAIILSNSELCEEFSREYIKTEDDPLNPEWIDRLEGKLESICSALSSNLDEDNMWSLAHQHYGRKYFAEGDAFCVAIQDPLEEFERYAKQLASDGYPAIALEFSIMGYERFEDDEDNEFSSDYGTLRDYGPDYESIWKAILSNQPSEKHHRLLSTLIDRLGDEPICHDFVAKECHSNADTSLVLNHLDIEINSQLEEYQTEYGLFIPSIISKRISVMQKMGLESDAVAEYLLTSFGRLPFVLKFLLDSADKRNDNATSLSLCMELIQSEHISDSDKIQFVKKSLGYQKNLNLPGEEIQTLLYLVKIKEADDENIFRLRELLARENWIKLRNALIENSGGQNGWPKPSIVSCLLEMDGEYDALWEYLKKHPEKPLWLMFFDQMSALHPEEYASLLLSKVWESNSYTDDDGIFHRRDRRSMHEVYEEAARNIDMVMSIPGQKAAALRTAHAIFDSCTRSRPLKLVWMNHGFV